MFTVEETKTKLRAIIEANPDAVNPRVDGLCAYWKDQPEEGEAQRCLIGQLLFEVGIDLPREFIPDAVDQLPSPYIDQLWALFEPDAIPLLSTAQLQADMNANPWNGPLRGWGSLLTLDFLRSEATDA